VDVTTEEQLLRTVPYLIQQPNPHAYLAEITNGDDRKWIYRLPSFLFYLWPPHTGDGQPIDKWTAMDFPTRVAYMLGWRYLSFSASIFASGGTVSRMQYTIEPDVLLGFPVGYFVYARTAHGFMRSGRPMPVDSAGEGSPNFRFGAIAGEFSWLKGADLAIAVAYTPAAPRDMVAHVFQADLSCFWGITGCDSVRQVVPLLWQDREQLVDKTNTRFASTNPCPDEILAGRIRTLPDVSVALLEVVRSRTVEVNREGERTMEIATDYQLKEAIWGEPQGPWTGILYRPGIQWKPSPNGLIANPIPPSFPKPGERFLFFGGATFDSCRVVRATPSAESAVRNAVAAPRRGEDYSVEGRK